MGWRVQQYTSTTTITAPAELIFVSGCGGGGGGGGGDPTPGGGGGGGGPSPALRMFPLFVTVGESLSLVIGAGGAGGSAGSDGTYGGETTILRGTTQLIGGLWANGGNKGTPSAGGAVRAVPYGTAGAYGASGLYANYMAAEFANAANLLYFSGTAGGALSQSGGARIAACIVSGVYTPNSTGNASGGGGGHGGLGPFAATNGTDFGGIGGSNGAAGTAARGYGCGGGGGSGNSAGGDGSPGVLWLCWFEDAYTGGDTSGTTTLLGRVVGTLASGTHQPQSGDAYARLGAPAGASVSADIATKASQASVNALADRLAEQVPTGPVMVLPAPETGQTVAYVRCLSSAGAAESEVIVHVQMVRTRAGATGYAYSGDALVGESNADGLAAITIPRAPGAIFRAWRGDGGRQVTFAGVDAETVAIPDLLGD